MPSMSMQTGVVILPSSETAPPTSAGRWTSRKYIGSEMRIAMEVGLSSADLGVMNLRLCVMRNTPMVNTRRFMLMLYIVL